jgi:hypothetical protein
LVSHGTDGSLLSSAISTAGVEVTANKNQNSGYAGLDGSGKISIVNLPTGTTSTTVALGNMVGTSRTILPITGAATGAAADNVDYVYYWTGSTAYTYTQPTAVSNTGLYTLKNSSTVNQTVAFTGGQNADGTTTITLTPNSSIDLISNNSNYMIV